ncbi:glycosyltransferase family 4 protein [bacterium]|nr:glycosyltransferase family 4 protein [bacterium]
MKISIAATNPCHVWALGKELHRLRALGCYYSGYPEWKLRSNEKMPLRSHSARTLLTYFLHGKVAERFRPSNMTLFRWQDEGFDRWVAKVLEPADFHHGIPGQCLHSFRRARELGIRTVLNHATGPAAQVAKILQPEYNRIGKTVAADGGFAPAYLNQIAEESSLSDFHCCASTVVRDQLVALGVPGERIWVVPYGADPQIWRPENSVRERKSEEPFRILFAGQVSLRKGLRFVLDALQASRERSWQLDVYGPLLDETRADREAYRGKIPVYYHGAVNQRTLAEAMRHSDLLVLPSLEEGFGLVVVQALSCGLPCAVSSMVGAKDLIKEGVNGTVFPVQNAQAISKVFDEWSKNSKRVCGSWDWKKPAMQLVDISREAV